MMTDEPTIEPTWRDDVPWCSQACGSWAHGRLRFGYCVLGDEPHDLCEPAVKQMAKRIAELEATVGNLPKDAEGNPCLTADVRYAVFSDGKTHAGNVTGGMLICLVGHEVEKISLREAYGTRQAARKANAI